MPCVLVMYVINFNPRPRKEGDKACPVIWAGAFYFNPRPRKEGDTFEEVLKNPTNHFNPRPRKEGDNKYLASGYTV